MILQSPCKLCITFTGFKLYLGLLSAINKVGKALFYGYVVHETKVFRLNNFTDDFPSTSSIKLVHTFLSGLKNTANLVLRNRQQTLTFCAKGALNPIFNGNVYYSERPFAL